MRALYFPADNGQVEVFDTATWSHRRLGQKGPRAWGLSVSPSGRWIATGHVGGRVQVIRAQDGGPVMHAATASSHVTSLTFSPTGDRLAGVGSDGSLHVWSVATGVLVMRVDAHGRWVNSVSWSADGTRILTASDDFHARVWSSTDGRLIHEIRTSAEVRRARFADDGTVWLADGKSLVAYPAIAQHFPASDALLRRAERAAGARFTHTRPPSLNHHYPGVQP